MLNYRHGLAATPYLVARLQHAQLQARSFLSPYISIPHAVPDLPVSRQGAGARAGPAAGPQWSSPRTVLPATRLQGKGVAQGVLMVGVTPPLHTGLVYCVISLLPLSSGLIN